MTEDEAAIRALVETRIEAMQVGNAEAALATLAPDMVAFELGPPLQLAAGQARDLAAFQAWLDSWETLAIKIEDLTVHVSGEVAFAHSLNRLTGTRRSVGSVEFWMRSTLGFRKVGGAWTIVHGHTSVPFAMDGSYRALLDLQP